MREGGERETITDFIKISNFTHASRQLQVFTKASRTSMRARGVFISPIGSRLARALDDHLVCSLKGGNTVTV